MSEPVRLGSIGLGWWGGVLADGVHSSGFGKVVACYARSHQSREKFAAEYDCRPADSLEELLESSEIDGVLIATPHTTHAELALRAAETSKHIFIDKPLTLTVSHADAVIAAADAARVVLQVGHNRRRQPANRRIHELIRDGELGNVHSIQANHSAPLLFNPTLPAWRRQASENPVGGMTALGVHQVDTFQYLVGPVTRVRALSTRLLPEGEVDDISIISLEFESGALGQLLISQATGPVVDVQVNGIEAVARNLGDGSSLTLQRRGSTDVESIEIEQLDTIADELGEFCRAIRGEVEPETDGRVGRSVVAVLEAIVRSAETGDLVEVVSEGIPRPRRGRLTTEVTER